jgi:2'-5' RNA ligase
MFVAAVPPPPVADALEASLAPRREADPSWRWGSSDQWHLTLAFFAEVTRCEDLIGAVTAVAARTDDLTVVLGGAGAFPHPDQAKVLWLAVDDGGTGALEHLARGCRTAGRAAGVSAAGGAFRPHLTLARRRYGGPASRWLRVLDSLPDLQWRVEEVAVIESHLGRGKHGTARHEIRARLPLRH